MQKNANFILVEAMEPVCLLVGSVYMKGLRFRETTMKLGLSYLFKDYLNHRSMFLSSMEL